MKYFHYLMAFYLKHMHFYARWNKGAMRSNLHVMNWFTITTHRIFVHCKFKLPSIKLTSQTAQSAK